MKIERPEEDDEEEKFENIKDGATPMKDRTGTLAGPPLADQFDEDEDPPFDDAGQAAAKSSNGGRKTQTSQYKCNNGKMWMNILASEQRGKGTNVHT